MTAADVEALGVPLWSKPKPEEPAHGLFMRLAEINGQGPDEIARALGFSLASLRRGENITKLANFIRVDAAELAASSFLFAVGEKVSIRGEQIGLRDVVAGARRICALCVRMSNHHRFWWDIDFVDCCPHHEIMLTDRCSCPQAGRLSWKDSGVGRCFLCDDPHQSVAETMEEPPNPHQLRTNRYFLGRLGICAREESQILDALPLDEAVETVTKVGALLMKGYTENWPDLTHEERMHCRALGFHVLDQGVLGQLFHHTFESFMRCSPPEMAFNPSRGRSFGWFYHWFNGKGGANYSAGIAKVFEQVVERTVDSCGGGLPSRSNIDINDFYMNLGEAADACRQGKTTMRRILKQFGKDRSLLRKGLPLRIEASVVNTLSKALIKRCNYDKVRAMLGAGHLTVRRFVESGFFTPLIRGGCDRHEYIFDEKEITEFLEILGKDVPLVDYCPEDALPLQDAARTYAAPIDRLCLSIILGHTQLAGRLTGTTGLAQFVIAREMTLNFRRWYVEEGEDYLLRSMFEFKRMKQLDFDLRPDAGRSVA